MFMLAGLLGLMAAGTAAVMTFDFNEPEEELDEDIGAGSDGIDAGGPDNLLEDLIPEEEAPSAADTAGEEDASQIIAGDESDEAIEGGTGNDQINGYEGDDTLDGAEGEDHLYGDDGDDLMAGGGDDDLLHGEAGTDNMSGDSGDDTLFGHSGDDVLDGGDGADSLIGGFGADSLDGGEGSDALHGREGDDILRGGEGEDILFGGDGADLLDGRDDAGDMDFLNGGDGDGDDVILVGAGDIATGGDGMDSFLLSQWHEVSGETTIMDFDRDEDSLVLLYEDTGGSDPEVEVRADVANPDTGAIYVNGFQVATVHGGGDLSPAEITLLPQGSAGAAELVRV